MNEIFENLYDMTAFSNIIAEPQFLIMYAIAFVLLYLGIKKQYEPLLLVPKHSRTASLSLFSMNVNQSSMVRKLPSSAHTAGVTANG